MKMESPINAPSETQVKHDLQFHCPACGETSVILLSSPYQLAPGDGFFKCPWCESLFCIEIGFSPLDDAPEEQ